ncbi:MAG: RNA-binding protein [Bacteroidetes bacterium]|nr:RNA-binding protein [Bacteroidota bacterium]MCH8523268.1 RNA-binding protein [Balneolales bacterium]
MNIYVGNLPYSTDEQVLTELFSQYGEVTRSSVITDRATGRSRGFGFVEMANDEEALSAIESTDGADFGGRSLVVNEAKPRQERPQGGRPRNDRRY